MPSLCVSSGCRCVRYPHVLAAAEVVQHIHSPDFLSTLFLVDAFMRQSALLLPEFCLGVCVFTWAARSLPEQRFPRNLSQRQSQRPSPGHHTQRRASQSPAHSTGPEVARLLEGKLGEKTESSPVYLAVPGQ